MYDTAGWASIIPSTIPENQLQKSSKVFLERSSNSFRAISEDFDLNARTTENRTKQMPIAQLCQ